MAERRVAAPDYRAGEDVRGRPVVGADLDANAGADLLASVQIEIDWIVGADRHGPRRTAADATVIVGTIGFDAAGRLTLNGRPLSAGDRSRVREVCGEADDREGQAPLQR